jgi:hypothetical protein
MTGYPPQLRTNPKTSAGDETEFSVPAIVGIPASFATWRADILSPTAVIHVNEGPMNIMLAFLH